MTISLLLIILLLAVLLYRSFRLERRLQLTQEQLQQTVRREARGLFNQCESYHYLRDRLNLRQGIPYTRDWSASPDFLKLIVEHCLEQRPATIVECSSGLTTLMLARSCELNGAGRLYSLENGADYAAKSRAQLARYGLDQAQVLDAPLRDYLLHGTSYQWYDIAELPAQGIEMLVIDGPPGFIQRHSRYPALPLLIDRLADNCTIFLDDAARADEQEIVRRWLAQFPWLQHHYVETERGCSVLYFTRP
ncbi:MAG: class I SAM-dependent methyltransferase [Gammaproteobacteria bacterium]|nr:class I SAM-dependent methyltransferase [Gammaproteobacteria bacterium]